MQCAVSSVSDQTQSCVENFHSIMLDHEKQYNLAIEHMDFGAKGPGFKSSSASYELYDYGQIAYPLSAPVF